MALHDPIPSRAATAHVDRAGDPTGKSPTWRKPRRFFVDTDGKVRQRDDLQTPHQHLERSSRLSLYPGSQMHRPVEKWTAPTRTRSAPCDFTSRPDRSQTRRRSDPGTTQGPLVTPWSRRAARVKALTSLSQVGEDLGSWAYGFSPSAVRITSRRGTRCDRSPSLCSDASPDRVSACSSSPRRQIDVTCRV